MARQKPTSARKSPRPADVSAPKSNSGKNSATSPWIYLLPALLLGLLVFAQTLRFDFVNWDDDVNILENQNVLNGDWSGIWTETVIGNYNPLTISTFAIEYALVGDEAWLFHFNNLWLHLLTVGLVFALALRLRLNPLWAAVAAALFAIHPMRVESVAWVTERKDVLFAAFYFGALLLYERRRQEGKSGSWFWGVAGLFLLALLAKIQAVSLPLSMLCLDYLRDRKFAWSEILNKAGYFAMSLAIGLIGVYFLGRDGSLDEATTYTFFDRLAVGAYAFTVYLIKVLMPYEHSPLYPYPSKLPIQAYLSFGVVAAVLGALYLAWKKGLTAWVFALSFFIVNVVFMLQVLGAGQGYLADRFTYVGYFGLFWGMAHGLQYLWEKNASMQGGIRMAAWGYVLLLSLLAFRQTKIWANGDTLWAHVSELYPGAATAWGNRAMWLRDEGKIEEAMTLYAKAIEANPNDGAYYNSRGKLYFDQDNTEAALADYNRGIEVDPELGELYINRGAAFAKNNELNRAEVDFNKGIELDPENFNGYLNRSLLYYIQERNEEALKDYDTMLEMRPQRHDLWNERGSILLNMGRNAEGRASIETAISKAADDPEAQRKYRENLNR